MATKPGSSVINETPAAPAASAPVVTLTQEAQRAKVLETVTFREACDLAMSSARWTDVEEAADLLAKGIHNAGIGGEKTVSAHVRKVGQLLPSDSFRLRMAIVSYQLSGRRANPTQLAGLAAKLPSLRKFGAIVLPPSLGEF